MRDDTAEVRARVATRFRSERGPMADAVARLTELVGEEAPLLAAAEVERCARELAGELVGLGSLERLLDDSTVSDVLVNGPGRVWVERAGRLEPTTLELDRPGILRAIERLVAPLGLRADRAHPIVDGRMPDGTRVSVVMDPVAVDGPVVAIRRHGISGFDLDEMAEPDTARLLRGAVDDGANIAVYGSTGSGKTTLLNALGAEVPAGQRIVVIEDVAELRICAAHVVRLEGGTRTADHPEGMALRPLVRAALRLRPDRIVVGEVRGAEAVDMVWALSTGHSGCMTTVHANDAADALRRVETMMVMGLGDAVPLDAIASQVRSAIDLLVGVVRCSDGRRRVAAVHSVGPGRTSELHRTES